MLPDIAAGIHVMKSNLIISTIFYLKQLKKNIQEFQAIWACNNALHLVNDSSLVQLL